jgi:hypothetical protein
VLRRIFGPKRDEVIGGWRKLHNEELHNLYSFANTIRMMKPKRMRWTWRLVCMGEKRNAGRVLVGEPEGKRPLGRPRPRYSLSYIVLYTCFVPLTVWERKRSIYHKFTDSLLPAPNSRELIA